MVEEQRFNEVEELKKKEELSRKAFLKAIFLNSSSSEASGHSKHEEDQD